MVRDGKPPEAELVELARQEECEGCAGVFVASDGRTYGQVHVGGHTEVLNLAQYRAWLRRRYYEEHKTPASGQAITTALETLEAIAQGAEVRKVCHRVGWDGEVMFLDLGDPTWCAVRVDVSGWRVVPSEQVTVLFRRPAGMKSLPVPKGPPDMAALRQLLNLSPGDSDAWAKVACWLVSALHPRQHYLLGVDGEEGSGKSVLTEMVRGVIDPVEVPLRRIPHKQGDTAVASRHGYVLAYDNVSALPQELSDELCQMALGRGGHATRKLYTDEAEVTFAGHSPIILNGIEPTVTSADLRNRTLFLTLPRIDSSKRRTDEALETAYAEVLPRVLAGVLDAVSKALKHRHAKSLKTGALERQADSQVWVMAAEIGGAFGWGPGTVAEMLKRQRRDAAEAHVQNDLVASAMMAFMEHNGPYWQGTMGELYRHLSESRTVTEGAKHSREWPTSEVVLGRRLARLSRTLGEMGLSIEKQHSRTGTKYKLHLSRDEAA